MRALAKLVIKIIFLVLIFPTAFAATDVQKYQVTLSTFELYNGTSWVTVFEGTSSPLDIASASSGQTIGNFMSGLSVPDGTYTKARATPSITFTIRGIVNSGGTDYYTTGTQVSDGQGRTVSTVSAVGPAQDCTVTVLASDMTPGAGGVTFSGGSITVTNGVPDKKVKVFFDMSAALTTNLPLNTVIYPGGPIVTMTVE